MSGIGAVGGAGASMSVGATPQISSHSTPSVSQSHKMPEDTLTISDEAIALLHGHKHKKKEEDILLLVYPRVAIHGGSHGITAQATPGGSVSGVSAAGGAAASGGGAAGGAGGGGGGGK